MLSIIVKGADKDSFLFEEIEVPKDMIPGNFYTGVYKVSNPNNYDIDIDIEIILPIGWKLITKKEVKSLKPFEEKKIYYTYKIPLGARSGNYNILFNVKRNKKTVRKISSKLNIAEISDLEIIPLKKPDYIHKEKTFDCTFLIKNKGNREEKVFLETISGEILDKTTIKLGVDSSKVVTIQQISPKNITKKTTVISTLIAYLESNDKKIVKRVPITIYPNSTPDVDLYHRFPVEVGTQFNYGNNSEKSFSSMQYTLKGKGYLDEDRNHFLEINVQGPDQTDLERFGNYDAYMAHYKNKKWDVQVGDYGLNLSTLTELGRFGRGLSVQRDFSAFKLKTFYHEPRFYPEIEKELGAQLETKVASNVTLKGNWIQKQFSDPLLEDQNLVSLEGEYNTDNFQLETEIASATDFEGSNQLAVRNNLSFQLANFNIQSSIIKAGEDFEGYYSDSEYYNHNLDYYLGKKWVFSLSHNQSSINPKLDTIQYNTAPFFENYTLGTQYKFGRQDWVQLNYSVRDRKDRLENKQYDYREYLLRYRLSKSWEKLVLEFDGELGKVKNYLVSDEQNQDGNTYRNRIGLRYAFSKKIGVGANVEYLVTNRYSTTNEEENFFFFGGNIRYDLNKKLSFSLNYKNNYTPDQLYKTRSFFDLTTNYTINNKHTFSLFSSYAIFPGEKNEEDLYITAQYAVKFNIPVKKVKEYGHLKGRLIPQNNERIEGIIVNLGTYSTITNELGIFEFKNIYPDEYYLSLDRGSMDFKDITLEKTPYFVKIMPNEVSEVDLTIIKSAEIKGKVSFAKKDKDLTSSKFESNTSFYVVKLYNEDETFYADTNEKGEYRFKSIRPGNWNVEVVKNGWEAKNKAKPARFEYFLKQNEVKEVNFEIIPKKRKVRFSNKNIKLKTS